MKYRMQVEEFDGFEFKATIWLGSKLAEMPEVIQKRWVRQRVEKEFGSPIKNPTQKLYVWNNVFTKTELTITTDDEYRWDIVVGKPLIKKNPFQ